MGHESSIYHLFKRSMYCAGQGDSDDKISQDRKELFAVAALGLALKHDAEFCRFFLQRICEIDDARPEHFKITCQDGDCSDLRLTDEKLLISVEAKVEAKLQPHQMPWEKAFVDTGPPAGYGRQMQLIPGWEQAKYVLLMRHREPRIASSEARPGRPITVVSKTWDTLAEYAAPKTSFAADLFDSFARIGVSTFAHRLFMKRNLLASAGAAAEIRALLISVAKNIGIDGRTMCWDSSFVGNARHAPSLQCHAPISNPRASAVWTGFGALIKPRT